MEFLKENLKKILICGTVFLGIVTYSLLTKEKKEKIIEYNNYIENSGEITENEKIKIHIFGEIINQGVIELETGARICDAIEKAGGATENADLNRINLAYKLDDGQKIYIPSIEDDLKENYITYSIIEENQGNIKININTASQTELEKLTGIGPSTALKIIDYREKNGKFKTIEDIKNVPSIGDSKFETIKDFICVK